MDKQFETEHYIFHYGANTKTEQDISEIAADMQTYRQQNMSDAMVQVYHRTPAELNQAFMDYVRLFRIDEVLEKRMLELSKKWGCL